MKLTKRIALPVAMAATLIAATASAQVIGPRVALQFATNGLTSPLEENSSDAVIARLLLDTTGSTEAVRINSLPFNLVTGGGASASTLMNCRVFNEADLDDELNSADDDDTLSSGINNISLTNALVLQPNTMTTLSLRCDIDDDLVSGGTYTVNMNTANVVATGATTGLAAVVTVRGAVVVPPVVIPPTPTTPGMPTTGAADQASQSIAMIAASLLMASLGFSYLKLRKS